MASNELAYQEVCTTYHRFKDFRAKLLALLPLATGTGAFFILKESSHLQGHLGWVGLFGLGFSIGLFLYEIHGTLLVNSLINEACELESKLGLENGQFLHRKDFPLFAGNAGAICAAFVVYISVIFAWVYIAIHRFCNCLPKP